MNRKYRIFLMSDRPEDYYFLTADEAEYENMSPCFETLQLAKAWWYPLGRETRLKNLNYMHYTVRGQLIQKPDCPTLLLKKFAESANCYDKEAIARHPKCDKDLLVQMLTTPCLKFKESALKNPNLPDEVRTKLMETDYDG